MKIIDHPPEIIFLTHLGIMEKMQELRRTLHLPKPELLTTHTPGALQTLQAAMPQLERLLRSDTHFGQYIKNTDMRTVKKKLKEILDELNTPRISAEPQSRYPHLRLVEPE